MVKTYLKCYLYFILIFFCLSLILSIMNYLFNNELYIFKVLIPVFSFLVSSFVLGLNSKRKAYLEGIKFSSVYVILSLIISFIIIKNSFSVTIVIYYISLIISCVIGSMIGINFKKDN